MKKNMFVMVFAMMFMLIGAGTVFAADGVGNPDKGIVFDGAILNGIEKHMDTDLEYTTLTKDVPVIIPASAIAECQAYLVPAERVQTEKGICLKLDPVMDFNSGLSGFFANYDPAGPIIVSAKLKIANKAVFIPEDECWKNTKGEYQPHVVFIPLYGDYKYYLIAGPGGDQFCSLSIFNADDKVVAFSSLEQVL